MCNTTRIELGDEPTEGQVTTAVVRTIAGASGQTPTSLDFCLADYLDPDALEALLVSGRDAAVELTATFDDYRVTVSPEGVVTATERCATPETCQAPVIGK